MLEPGDSNFEFAFHDVETLNLEVQAGLWDLSKISYANYPYCSDRYRLLHCGGALGRGCGPLLLSNRSGWDPEAEVLVPGQYTTANFLLDFCFPDTTLRKVFLPFDQLYRRLLSPEPCQGVVIHEMRFTYAADGLHLIQDLGEFWEWKTSHPIPLGAVALRNDFVVANPGIASQIESIIRRSLDWAYAHPEPALALCRQYSHSSSEDVLKAHIDLYVNEFSRELGSEGDAAVAYFLASHRRLHASTST